LNFANLIDIGELMDPVGSMSEYLHELIHAWSCSSIVTLDREMMTLLSISFFETPIEIIFASVTSIFVVLDFDTGSWEFHDGYGHMVKKSTTLSRKVEV